MSASTRPPAAGGGGGELCGTAAARATGRGGAGVATPSSESSQSKRADAGLPLARIGELPCDNDLRAAVRAWSAPRKRASRGAGDGECGDAVFDAVFDAECGGGVSASRNRPGLYNLYIVDVSYTSQI
jgi:hypothetical protein